MKKTKRNTKKALKREASLLLKKATKEAILWRKLFLRWVYNTTCLVFLQQQEKMNYFNFIHEDNKLLEIINELPKSLNREKDTLLYLAQKELSTNSDDSQKIFCL